MIREFVGREMVPPEENFRWRGGEITRLEGFTDAVFAFAVTLIVVSLEVPRTFSDLALVMKGFFAFAICFAVLVHVWHCHYIYSRRYGLQTSYSVFLNSALLFVVLFYVYPLKFIFTVTIGELFGAYGPRQHGPAIQTYQFPALVAVFSLGQMAVFAVFALLYGYAYGKRRELDLNEYESLRTRHDMVAFAVLAAVGLLVAVTAQLLPVRISPFSACLLILGGVYGLVSKPILRKKEKVALERVQQAVSSAVTMP